MNKYKEALAMLKHRLDFNAYKYCDGHIVLKDRYKRTIETLRQLINEHFDNNLTTEVDKLKDENARLQSIIIQQNIKEMNYIELRKALDKACDELASLDEDYALWFNQMVDKYGLYSYREYKNEEQWKEYLLNEK